MHTPDVHEVTEEQVEVAKEFLSKGRREAIRGEIEQLVQEEFEHLEDHAADFLAARAGARAEHFLLRVLKGDEDAAMALLGDKYGGSRHRLIGLNKGKPWAELIHGKLFETNGIRLRRQIVEAHAELLRSERIKDLEAVVEGLEAQVRKKDAEIERLHRELPF